MPVIEEVKKSVIPKGKNKKLIYFAIAGVLLAGGTLAYRQIKGTTPTGMAKPDDTPTPDASTAVSATDGVAPAGGVTKPTTIGDIGTEPQISVTGSQLLEFQKQVNAGQGTIVSQLTQLQHGQAPTGINTVPQQTPVMAVGGVKPVIPSANQAQISEPADITTHAQAIGGQVGNKPLTAGAHLPAVTPGAKSVTDLQIPKK